MEGRKLSGDVCGSVWKGGSAVPMCVAQCGREVAQRGCVYLRMEWVELSLDLCDSVWKGGSSVGMCVTLCGKEVAQWGCV